MCNVNQETTLTEITGYKIVCKFNKQYISYFAGKVIKIGKVSDFPFKEKISHNYFNKYRTDGDSALFNISIVGKTTIFKNFKDAMSILKTLSPDDSLRPYIKIIKIKIKGNPILTGTSDSITWNPDCNYFIVYAGEEIVEFNEVNFLYN
jgi:hypothetical protein